MGSVCRVVPNGFPTGVDTCRCVPSVVIWVPLRPIRSGEGEVAYGADVAVVEPVVHVGSGGACVAGEDRMS